MKEFGHSTILNYKHPYMSTAKRLHKELYPRDLLNSQANSSPANLGLE